jgi:phage terminase Nu1 subunit (DNA packaging protein)
MSIPRGVIIIMTTQKQVAAHLDLSQAAVSQLVASSILKPTNGRGSYSLDECRVAYIRHLREVAAGRSAGDPDAPNLVLERARLARAQAVAQERKNREADGELIDMQQAESLFFEVSRTARDAWLNWPSRISPLIAATIGTPFDPLFAALNEHVHQQLSDLGDPDLATALLERRD